MCKRFPIDQRDIDEVTRCGGTCGYRFEKPLLDSPPPVHFKPISGNGSGHFRIEPLVFSPVDLTPP
jgi:hypothetical protein